MEPDSEAGMEPDHEAWKPEGAWVCAHQGCQRVEWVPKAALLTVSWYMVVAVAVWAVAPALLLVAVG